MRDAGEADVAGQRMNRNYEAGTEASRYCVVNERK